MLKKTITGRSYFWPIRLLVLLAVGNFSSSFALDNGLARLPPMGYNTWNDVGCDVDEKTVLSRAEYLVSSGLKDLGYVYVNIDDCWQAPKRDPDTSQLVPDPRRFPNGMRYLADKIHSLGLLFGIYTDRGTETCARRPGSHQFEELDARVFSRDWHVDFVKIDNCYADQTREAALLGFQAFRDATLKQERKMLYSVCGGGWTHAFLDDLSFYAMRPFGEQLSNMWRISADVVDDLTLVDAVRHYYGLQKYGGPGGWNDIDMLIGSSLNPHAGTFQQKKLGPTASRSQFSLYAVLGTPLLIGAPLTKTDLTKFDLATYSNKLLLAVNQQARQQGSLVWYGQFWLSHIGYREIALDRSKLHILSPALAHIVRRVDGAKKEATTGSIKSSWKRGDVYCGSEEDSLRAADFYATREQNPSPRLGVSTSQRLLPFRNEANLIQPSVRAAHGDVEPEPEQVLPLRRGAGQDRVELRSSDSLSRNAERGRAHVASHGPEKVTSAQTTGIRMRTVPDTEVPAIAMVFVNHDPWSSKITCDGGCWAKIESDNFPEGAVLSGVDAWQEHLAAPSSDPQAQRVMMDMRSKAACGTRRDAATLIEDLEMNEIEEGMPRSSTTTSKCQVSAVADVLGNSDSLGPTYEGVVVGKDFSVSVPGGSGSVTIVFVRTDVKASEETMIAEVVHDSCPQTRLVRPSEERRSEDALSQDRRPLPLPLEAFGEARTSSEHIVVEPYVGFPSSNISKTSIALFANRPSGPNGMATANATEMLMGIPEGDIYSSNGGPVAPATPRQTIRDERPELSFREGKFAVRKLDIAEVFSDEEGSISARSRVWFGVQMLQRRSRGEQAGGSGSQISFVCRGPLDRSCSAYSLQNTSSLEEAEKRIVTMMRGDLPNEGGQDFGDASDIRPEQFRPRLRFSSPLRPTRMAEADFRSTASSGSREVPSPGLGQLAPRLVSTTERLVPHDAFSSGDSEVVRAKAPLAASRLTQSTFSSGEDGIYRGTLSSGEDAHAGPHHRPSLSEFLSASRDSQGGPAERRCFERSAAQYGTNETHAFIASLVHEHSNDPFHAAGRLPASANKGALSSASARQLIVQRHRIAQLGRPPRQDEAQPQEKIMPLAVGDTSRSGAESATAEQLHHAVGDTSAYTPEVPRSAAISEEDSLRSDSKESVTSHAFASLHVTASAATPGSPTALLRKQLDKLSLANDEVIRQHSVSDSSWQLPLSTAAGDIIFSSMASSEPEVPDSPVHQPASPGSDSLVHEFDRALAWAGKKQENVSSAGSSSRYQEESKEEASPTEDAGSEPRVYDTTWRTPELPQPRGAPLQTVLSTLGAPSPSAKWKKSATSRMDHSTKNMINGAGSADEDSKSSAQTSSSSTVIVEADDPLAHAAAVPDPLAHPTPPQGYLHPVRASQSGVRAFGFRPENRTKQSEAGTHEAVEDPFGDWYILEDEFD
ncbi:unnamed protein product [Amoebophrya sp. A25]|nr:unnamed protein product [Amoebophrya sp. A25]|eukprot:GSA25T00005197001.1